MNVFGEVSFCRWKFSVVVGAEESLGAGACLSVVYPAEFGNQNGNIGNNDTRNALLMLMIA